jgi:hypothetical protein
VTGNQAAVAADLRAIAAGLEGYSTKALQRTALAQKKLMLDSLDISTHGTRTLHGVGRRGQVIRKGARLNVRYDLARGSQGQVVRMRATGPWQFIEHPRRAGYPIPRGADRLQRGRLAGGGYGIKTLRERTATRVLHFGGRFVATSKGGRGRPSRPWSRTLPVAVEATPPIFLDELHQLVVRSVHG